MLLVATSDETAVSESPEPLFGGFAVHLSVAGLRTRLPPQPTPAQHRSEFPALRGSLGFGHITKQITGRRATVASLRRFV